MAQTVIGMFDNAAEAQQAVERLTSKGFSRGSIDVSNNASSSSDSSYSNTTGSSSYSDNDRHEEGGITKFFKSLFGDDDSDKYENVARRSQSIVTVHAQTKDEAEDAADILDDCGAVDVDERAAAYGYSGTGSGSTGGYTGNNSGNDFSSNTGDTSFGTAAGAGLTGAAAGAGLTGATSHGNSGLNTGDSDLNTGRGDFDLNTGRTDLNSTDETRKIPIIEENLEVGKREVQRGGVRLRSRIVERPVEESLRLREESVRVERTPVDRAATSADLSNFKETEIEMTETAEVPVVSKESRVVEEVSLGKEVNERTETISDTVRSTEVDVDNLDSGIDTDRTGTGYNSNTGNRGSNL
jgi:uncharacterized protein (TIGR02271 family)